MARKIRESETMSFDATNVVENCQANSHVGTAAFGIRTFMRPTHVDASGGGIRADEFDRNVYVMIWNGATHPILGTDRVTRKRTTLR